jgi:16S rRNA (cytidine1402-2'-O)-methyltransferase
MTFDPSILQAAHAATQAQNHPASTLYVVATPIGNVADLTLRAIHILAEVDAIACEDTRHTAGLLRQMGLPHKTLLALHAHNEHVAAQAVIERLARGERVAYVSDAGTPAVSDPGAILVAHVRKAGFRCLPIPGASSALAALSVAGDVHSQGFVFIGFLPTRASERATALEALTQAQPTQIVFEAPHRIAALAQDLSRLCPDRRLTVCRELTKQFESIQTLDCAELTGWLTADSNHCRGEFVLVLHALSLSTDTQSINAVQHDRMLHILMVDLPLKQAVALAAQISGAPRNELYARALVLKAGSITPVDMD